MHQLTRRPCGARIWAKAIARPGWPLTIQIVAEHSPGPGVQTAPAGRFRNSRADTGGLVRTAAFSGRACSGSDRSNAGGCSGFPRMAVDGASQYVRGAVAVNCGRPTTRVGAGPGGLCRRIHLSAEYRSTRRERLPREGDYGLLRIAPRRSLRRARGARCRTRRFGRVIHPFSRRACGFLEFEPRSEEARRPAELASLGQRPRDDDRGRRHSEQVSTRGSCSDTSQTMAVASVDRRRVGRSAVAGSSWSDPACWRTHGWLTTASSRPLV